MFLICDSLHDKPKGNLHKCGFFVLKTFFKIHYNYSKNTIQTCHVKIMLTR